jgi:hypothetical protein
MANPDLHRDRGTSPRESPAFAGPPEIIDLPASFDLGEFPSEEPVVEPAPVAAGLKASPTSDATANSVAPANSVAQTNSVGQANSAAPVNSAAEANSVAQVNPVAQANSGADASFGAEANSAA